MRQSISFQGLTWIDIQNPQEEDVEFLEKNFDFHPMVLGELIPPGHRPKVEHHDDYLFLVLYYPIFDRVENDIDRRELDLIVTKNHLITSHYEIIVPLKTLFDQVSMYETAQKEYLSQTTGHLLYYIISGILQGSSRKTEDLEDDITHIERQIFKGREREMVFDISVAKRDLIDVRRILAPQSAIFDSLLREGEKFWGEELVAYFEDIRGLYGNTWNTIEEQRETLQALSQTNESLLSAKTNEVIKVLTIFSAIFLPLTLIASIWGMNTNYLPFSSEKFGADFWVVIGILLFAFGGMYAYFKRKGWL